MPLSLADRKLKVVQLIANLENENLLDYIELLLEQSEEKEDWAHHLSDKEKADIQEGLSDLKAGRSVPYETFKENLKKRFP